MESAKPSEAVRVLVIGAGSAGLLMGQIFKKAGIDVAIFEQDASPTARPRDWDFGVYWAQSRIDECLTSELKALVDTVQTDPSYRRNEGSVMPVYNGFTGKLISELPAPYAIRLRRRAWLDLIRTGLDVRYGKKLQSITATEEGITAIFEDGTAETGALLIGADGAHSVARKWLFQSSPKDAAMQDLPISSFVALTRLDRQLALDLRAVHPTYCIVLNPSGFFAWYSLHDGTSEDPAEWVYMILATWPCDDTDDNADVAKNNDLLLDRVCALAEPLAYPFDAMFKRIPRGTKAWYGKRVNYWPTRPWDSRGGLVTLAGDAAHALTFHRGQGLGNAITDVAELQTHLRAMKAHTRSELAEAIAKYEKEVWQRGYEVVMENRENTLTLHDWDKVSQSMLLVAGLQRH
ncbi:FAD/NAD(P)-binding domain-containing protein [Parathielavia hyrcaniae]|uniref:FAD/NAD(P)-binding domain-containing protein n=1 Tax=Parathielavia hyrcaniae TaxID=113614 RepID=A0AAN6T1V3_9PEZI|nr:FAD/NAD(P)-binding domain-containing protein [Parathielavia hyrcaniae]